MDDLKLKAAKSVFSIVMTIWLSWNIRIDFDTFCYHFYGVITPNGSSLKTITCYFNGFIKINSREFTTSYLFNNSATLLRFKDDQLHKGEFYEFFL